MKAAWAQATAPHRRWLFINAVLIAAVVNAALNALIAWGTAAPEDEVPLWAVPLVEGPSTITDTVGTLFILTFLTTLAVTTSAWHELREGRLPPIDVDRGADPLLGRMPPRRARRGAYFGLIVMLLLGPLAVVLLIAFDFDHVSVGDFVLYKAIFGVLLGALVTPPIALAALTDREKAEEKAEVARPGIEPGTP